MTGLRAEDVSSLAREEVELVADLAVRDALAGRLLPPDLHLRNWDYGRTGEQYPCWTIAMDPASNSALVYSERGHGPADPWGLVSLSDLWFGMDACWYLRLEDAFVQSAMAASLRIWDVVAPDGRAVLSSLARDEAFARRDLLNASLAKPVHHVLYRSRDPDGVR